LISEKLAKLARRLLGGGGGQPVDFSAVDRELAPVNAGRSASAPEPAREPEEKIDVLPEYEFVLEAIKAKAPAIFVTGRAGTGKTTLIRFLQSRISKCAVVAPTGMAAINVGGKTIHSFFGIPPRVVNPDEVSCPQAQIGPRVQMMPVIKELDVLVVDEVSMVTPNLIDIMDRILRKARRKDRPFGGISVVFVGDLLQLPPVVASQAASQMFSDRYRSSFFFSADVFSELDIYPIELTKVFRQEKQHFVDMLSKIRRNQNHRDAVAQINRDCFRDREMPNDAGLYLVPTNSAADGINTDQLNRLDSSLHVFRSSTTGVFDPSKNKPPAPDRLELKEGSQVLFVKNNHPYWLNGTVGRVVAIADDLIRVELPGVGNVVSVGREIWETIEYSYDPELKRIKRKVIGTFIQFPLRLGWAITIHKSQGMTLDKVRIDFGERGTFCAGQAYVALSRCRTLEGISLDRPISMNDVKADPIILEFYAKILPQDEVAS